jgi:predicted metal-dependent hydrolase
MRFLVRLENDGRFSPAEKKQLSKTGYEAVRDLGADIGNLRVSSKAVELDLLLNSETLLNDSLKALKRRFGQVLTVRKLDVASVPIGKAEAIKTGLELFNEERYWESHEALESAWRVAAGDEKEILQGLILVAAAFVHSQKNEKDIAISVLKRGLDKLSRHEGECSGIDITALKRKVTSLIATGQPEFFRIELNQL